MPKVKTRKIVEKRFKVTKTGKVLRGKQGGRHLRAQKSKSKKRDYKEPQEVFGKFKLIVKRLLPYS